jgi:hypothetical protein
LVVCEAGQGHPAFSLTLCLAMKPRHDGSTKLPTLILGENNQQMNVQRIVVWFATEQTDTLTALQDPREPMRLICAG